MLIFSIKNNLKKYCAKKRAKATIDMLKVAGCANKQVRLQVPCLNVFINETKQLIHLPDDSMKIPYACW